MTTVILDNPAQLRFEATLGGERAGFAAYELSSGTIVFTHTEVDPSFEGRGVGGALAEFAVAQARSRDLNVVAQCPFIQGWLERHPGR